MYPLNKSEAQLFIPKLILHPHLGLSEEERQLPQPVELGITINFQAAPHACISDEIKDTLCYHTLFNQFQNLIAEKQFKLIEYLGHELSNIICESLQAAKLTPATVELNIHKPRLPLAELPLGVTFSLTRKLESGVPS